MARIALALGGGGARGLAHIHVLEAIDEMGFEVVEIAGSSIGALMGCARASGMDGKQIRDHVMSTLGNATELVAGLWRMRVGNAARTGTLRTGRMPWLAPRLTDLDAERTVRAFLPTSLPDRLEDLSVPINVMVTDFYEQTGIAIRRGPLHASVGASAAIPGIFCPVQDDNRVLIDGGIANPVPFDVLGQTGIASDIVVAVDVVGRPVRHALRLPNKREQLFGASQAMMHQATVLKLRNAAPDVLLTPEVGGIGVLDFIKAQSILDATAPIRDRAKREIEAALLKAQAA